jgi:hypothetical protein
LHSQPPCDIAVFQQYLGKRGNDLSRVTLNAGHLLSQKAPVNNQILFPSKPSLEMFMIGTDEAIVQMSESALPNIRRLLRTIRGLGPFCQRLALDRFILGLCVTLYYLVRSKLSGRQPPLSRRRGSSTRVAAWCRRRQPIVQGPEEIPPVRFP